MLLTKKRAGLKLQKHPLMDARRDTHGKQRCKQNRKKDKEQNQKNCMPNSIRARKTTRKSQRSIAFK
jgi:hypothetical protein